MTELPGFGVLLSRLSERRGWELGDLAGRAGVPEAGLRALSGGAVPGPALLGRLAPALGLRVPDLYVIAGMEVPQELAPLDDSAGYGASLLAVRSRQLSPERRGELLGCVRALPQEERTRPVPAPRPYERYGPGFGALLLGMFANRNLTRTSGVRALYAVSGPVLSAATLGMVGHGRKELTPGLLTDFAHLLGVDAGDLAVLSGIGLPDGRPPHDPAIDDVAALLWEARRLSSAQVAMLRATLDASPEADVTDR